MNVPDERQLIRRAIIDLTRNQRVSDRLQPEAVTRSLGLFGGSGLLDLVREEAVKLAQAGRIALYRKSSVADPDHLTGEYTIGNPYSGHTDDRDYNVS